MARKKKVFNAETLSKQELESLSVDLGEQVRSLCDKAVVRANKILNKYNMECKMAFQIKELGSFPGKNLEQK